jgi:hypothetical protein
MINLAIVNLLNEDEVKKLASLTDKGNSHIKEQIQKGRTELVFDITTGEIILAVENGKLLFVSNENVKFRRL